jgi:hypothetical protein
MPNPFTTIHPPGENTTLPTALICWDLEKVVTRTFMSDRDLIAFRSERELITHVSFVMEESAREIGKYLVARCVVGKREETKTVQVPYSVAWSTSYDSERPATWWDMLKATRPWWVRLLTRMRLMKPPRWTTTRREFRGVEKGQAPFTYTTVTMIDPWVERHLGIEGRTPYVERVELGR